MSFAISIVADSVSTTTGKPRRLTTFSIKYPRFIHAEIMTHRMFSRNASSSRAIPVKRQLDRIRNDPAKPVEWGKNKAGMQSSEELTEEQARAAERIWEEACLAAIGFSERMDALNVHKQITNRIAEPFSHIAVILTGTEWANFFSLRDHPMAQPEFQYLARRMRQEYQESEPAVLKAGEWHLPYISDADCKAWGLETCIKASVARCARVSFLNHDGSIPDIGKDVGLHDTLVVQKPLHASPAEHQATPFMVPVEPHSEVWMKGRWMYPYDAKWDPEIGEPNIEDPWSGNLRGWFQYRQGLVGQNVTAFPWDVPA
jgi:hypothetical protein